MSETPRQPISVYEMLMMLTNEMAAIAWTKLGLQPDPMTGETAKDMDQAKAAVDAVSALVPIFEGTLDDEGRREVHNLLRNLKINYVEKLKE